MPTQAIGLATESNTAQPVINRLIGLATETDAALAVTQGKIVELGLGAELDSALSVLVRGPATAELLETRYDEDERGPRETWSYRVSGLAAADLTRRPEEACNATGYSRGDLHPTIAGIEVVRRAGELQPDASGYPQADRATVQIEFAKQTTDAVKNGGPTGLGLLESNLETFRETVYTDRNGDPMIVQYQGTTGLFRRRDAAEREGTALSYILTKAFPAPRYQDNVYAGFVNATAFGPHVAQSLLFRGVTFSQDADGDVLHRYTFSYSPDLWRYGAYITFGGILPDDASEAFRGGIARFFIQPEVDLAAIVPVRFP